MRTAWAIARVDLLRRIRRPSFLLFIAVLLLTSYYLVPGPTSGYTTLTYRGARGIYNSGYVGATVAVLTSLLMSLVGFYLVAGTVSTDRRTGLGYVIASTPLTRLTYICAKLVGNFLYLLTFPVVLWAASIAMQLWRGEQSVQLFVLAWPFLLLPVATAAVVAGIAMLFENIRWLRGTLGLVLYLFLWLTGLTLPVTLGEELASYLDPSGMVIVAHSLAHFFGSAVSLTDTDVALGIVAGKAMGIFDWPGIAVSMSVVWPRLGWAVLGLGLGIASAGLFDRFDPARERPRLLGRSLSSTPLFASTVIARPSLPGILSPHLFPGKAAHVGRLQQLKSLWQAEVRLALRSHRWFLPACALIALLAFVLPADDARRIGLLLALILPVGLLADLTCREMQANTFTIIATVPTLPQIYLLWKWGVGVMIALMAMAGLLVKFVLVGEPNMSLAILGGVAFVAAWAVVAGAWTHDRKTFIASYTLFWFLVGSNTVPPWLDYAGMHYLGQDVKVSLAYLGLAMSVIAISTWTRLRR